MQLLILALISYVGGKLFGKFPKVKKFYDQYRGEMIRIVKLVETEIPDGTSNKALHRLDLALQYTIRLIEKRENRALSEKEVAEVRSNLSEVHHEVESAGVL